MKLSKAVEGFLINCTAGNYAPTTVRLHSLNLRTLVRYLDDPNIKDITPGDLQRYMAYLRTDYKPARLHPSNEPYSDAARDNHWKSIRSLFGYAEENLGVKRPDLNLKQPRYEPLKINPFSEAEISALLEACERTSAVRGETQYTRRRPTAKRDKAMILTLLDTGLRVGELCRLEHQDIDQADGEIIVRPFSTGRKTKSRSVYLGKNARRAMWLYLATLDALPQDRIFPTSEQRVRNLLREIGRRAGVEDVHPHRFRHTMAIWYLRSGGDVFTLQRLLGHSSLDMVQHYLRIVNDDIKNAHRHASPADRIRA